MASKEDKRITLPVGRIINCSLFERDIYVNEAGKEGKAEYKCEIAFDPADIEGDDEEYSAIEEAIMDVLEEKWNSEVAQSYLDGEIKGPFVDGDRLAKKREANDKPGDAYKGKLVLRAHTQFNKHGEDAPGGIAVFLPDMTEVDATNRDEIYPGIQAKVAVQFGCYSPNSDEYDYGVTAYLVAVQKVEDGERLVSPQDHSKLFEPVGRKKGDSKTRRRSRSG